MARLEIQLSADKEYRKYPSFPPKTITGFKTANVDASLLILEAGKVIVNLRGALVDCIVSDSLSSGESVLCGLCALLTQKTIDLQEAPEIVAAEVEVRGMQLEY